MRTSLERGAARLPGDVVIDSGPSVEENDDADHGGRDEHLGVDAQPGEVQANLLPKILSAPQGKARQTHAYSQSIPGAKFTPHPLPSTNSSHGGPWFSTKQRVGGGGSEPGCHVWGVLSAFTVPTLPLLSPEDGSISSCNAHAAGRDAPRRRSAVFQPRAA